MKSIPCLLALLLSINAMAKDPKDKSSATKKETPVKNKQDTKTSQETYGKALGTQIAEQMQGVGVDLKDTAFVKGYVEAFTSFAKGKRLVSPEDTRRLVTEFQNDMNNRKSEDNKTKGQKYRDSLKGQKEWVAMPNGMYYKVIEMGKGEKPKATDTVETHYTGTLIDGTKFDSSRDRGKPTSFPLNQVIKGWTEGMQLMPVGSRFQFVIPPELAYGDGGAGQLIGPGSTLIFDIELISIAKGK